MARVGIQMTRGRWLLIGGIAIVVVSALWLATRGPRDVASRRAGSLERARDDPAAERRPGSDRHARSSHDGRAERDPDA